MDQTKPVFGMVHLPALPGSAGQSMTLDEVVEYALRDAAALAEGGADGMIVENFGDSPFEPGRVQAHTVACMAVIAREVRKRVDLPLGINVLRNDGLSALAVAEASGASFIRVNVYTGARLTDQGLIEGAAHELQRYRKLLGSSVKIFADVAVKHSSAIAPRGLAEEVEETLDRGRADAIIVSGTATGKETNMGELEVAKRAAGKAPVFAGSGVTVLNVRSVLSIADGVIAGTWLKKDGQTTGPVDPIRVKQLMAAARGR